MSDAGFYSDDRVQELTTLSKTQRRRLEQAGDFPKAVQISRRRRAYVAREIDRWCEAKIDAARGASSPKGA